METRTLRVQVTYDRAGGCLWPEDTILRLNTFDGKWYDQACEVRGESIGLHALEVLLGREDFVGDRPGETPVRTTIRVAEIKE